MDEGSINQTACGIRKQSENSKLRITFNGNLRITGCSDCCARWFVTIDGLECSDSIEGVVYSVNGSVINIHRAAVIAGMCGTTSDGAAISRGSHIVMMNVGKCEGFNETFNAYTGFSGVSSVTIEEIPNDCECIPSHVQNITRTRTHTHTHTYTHTHTHTTHTHTHTLQSSLPCLLLLNSRPSLRPLQTRQMQPTFGLTHNNAQEPFRRQSKEMKKFLCRAAPLTSERRARC